MRVRAAVGVEVDVIVIVGLGMLEVKDGSDGPRVPIWLGSLRCLLT